MSRIFNTLNQVRKESKQVGLDYVECLEMSYENLMAHANQMEKRLLKIRKIINPPKKGEN